ncbi:MAG: endolytic transglycosylase MltG [Bacteroidetes bacterium SW_9_63_38]|nr:MAG: endolytic transglycosylase MltG [Bacteroidetes bacterium SW_9_63_38]
MRTTYVPAFLVLLLAGLGTGVGGALLFAPNTAPYDGSRDFVLPEDATLEQAIDTLQTEHVLVSPATFRFVGRMTGWGAQLKAGHYDVEGARSNYHLLDMLRRGLQTPIRVTIPPGSRSSHIAHAVARRLKLDSAAAHAALRDTALARELGTAPGRLFGYMLPETYEFYWQTPARTVVRRIKESFDRYYAQHLKAGADSLGFTKQEVVTLASIVEWEAIHDAEKPTIAGVYVNRLREGWHLQADPTIQYVLLQTEGERTGRVLYRDLEIDHPYNTYKNSGLPPGPITNPSPTSLRAAVAPGQHEYFYFAADGSGGHTFSRTLREHNRAAEEYHRMLDKRRK